MITVMLRIFIESSSVFLFSLSLRPTLFGNCGSLCRFCTNQAKWFMNCKPFVSGFLRDILKNWIAEFEKQLADKYAANNFLSSQLTSNLGKTSNTREIFLNTGKNCCNCSNINERNKTVTRDMIKAMITKENLRKK